MKLKILGAAHTVTGSKHLVTTRLGKKILLDCGLYQGKSELPSLNLNFIFDPKTIDVVILSHAHVDHSGLLPKLAKDGFKGQVYATPATFDLCEVMLMDSAHIQEHDLMHVNKRRAKRHEKEIEPLYSAEDVTQILSQFVKVPYHQVVELDDNTTFTFTDAGHILGSAAVHVDEKDGQGGVIKLTFTGDVGRPFDKILPAPEVFRQADYIISESTYGDRLHPNYGNTEEMLFDIIQKTCVEQKGNVVIPAFSLDRTQELIYALDRMKNAGKIPHIKVFIDSPLSVHTTEIMRKHAELFNTEILDYMKRTDGEPFIFNDIHYVVEVNDSKELSASKEPCVIISASGMAEAGRIKHHIKNNITDKRNTILLVGYCTPDSLGGRLKAGNKSVKIFGDFYDVEARIESLESYSAHADYEEMVSYLKCQQADKVKTVFLVHGDEEAMLHYKIILERVGFKDVKMPVLEEEFQL